MHRTPTARRSFLAVALSSALSAACGAPVVSDGPDAAPADAEVLTGTDAPIDEPTPDAPPPRCDVAKPFDLPEKLRGRVNDAALGDFGPWLSDDEKRLYFTSERTGGPQLYLAVRASTDDDFGDPVLVDGLDGTNLNPAFSADQKTVYFEARRGNNTDTYFDVFRATRDDAGGAFDDPVRLDAVNATGLVFDGQPFLSANGQSLYITSNRAPVAERFHGIFQATMVRNELTIPASASPLIADGNNPVLTADEQRIYFQSNDRRVFTATRAGASGPFGAREELTTLDGPEVNDEDAPGWISPDGCVLYMHSDRGAVAQRDLYVAKRPL
jgi:hypothetical protein